jgi:hypothetical protein
MLRTPASPMDFDEALRVVADAADDLAAVAPGGTPADAIGLEQHHVEAALGQFQGRVDPAEAAADNDHVAADVCLPGADSRFSSSRWRRSRSPCAPCLSSDLAQAKHVGSLPEMTRGVLPSVGVNSAAGEKHSRSAVPL